MQRYYVRLNQLGQPSFLTRKDDPTHAPISVHDLPADLARLVSRVYGEFAPRDTNDVAAGQLTTGPVLIEWPDVDIGRRDLGLTA